ncbi:MAG: serine/threonine-protein phosphatase [Prevotella sp.]|nr:serine/threonine-protein phosphatase [Prevotella sp.]
MRKLLSVLILMLCGMLNLQAQSDAARKLKERQAVLYHTDSLQTFMDVSERLKKVLVEEGEEELFYDAWHRQIAYVLDNVSSRQALKMIDEMRDYVEKHKSKYGFIIVTFLNAHVAKNLGMNDRAEELVQQAIEYKKRNLPDTKPMLQLYFFLSRVYGERKEGEKLIQTLDRALKLPGWSNEEIAVLWSLKCNAVTFQEPVDTVGFMEYYKQMHAVLRAIGYHGNATVSTECYHAQLMNDYSRLLESAQKITDKGQRLKFKIIAYDGLEMNREAIDSFRVYNKWMDEQFNVETRKQAEMSALQLESARAENETETLRLTNQRMVLIGIVCGLVFLAVFLAIYLRRRIIQMRALREAYDQLEEVTIQKERIESELRIAHQIQMSTVPTDFQLHPALNIYGSMTPAKIVGGDLYDFFVREGQLFFCIGDVSGKGVSAAMFMMMTTSLFRTCSSMESRPDGILSLINKNLCENNRKNMFVTLLVGVLDLASGLLRYSSAGHENPIIIGSEATFLPLARVFPAGIIDTTVYQTQEIVMEPQTTLLLYTDGLTEARNANRELLGRQRILAEANRAIQAARTEPQEVIDRMVHAVSEFTGDTEQSDDLTLLAISLNPSVSMKSNQKK